MMYIYAALSPLPGTVTVKAEGEKDGKTEEEDKGKLCLADEPTDVVVLCAQHNIDDLYSYIIIVVVDRY